VSEWVLRVAFLGPPLAWLAACAVAIVVDLFRGWD
jgi:hypothetical protein